MDGYVKSLLELAEQSTAPATPDTGFLRLYSKDDGNVYIKDDTGAETQISGADSGGGVDEFQFPLNSFYMSGVLYSSSVYTGSARFPVINLSSASASTVNSPIWKPTQAFIDSVAAGKKVFVEIAVSSLATGAADVRGLLNIWDDSAKTWSTEFITKTVTISLVEDIYYVTYEFAATPALGDLLSFELYRGTGGTLGNNLSVSNVRIYTDTGAGS